MLKIWGDPVPPGGVRHEKNTTIFGLKNTSFLAQKHHISFEFLLYALFFRRLRRALCLRDYRIVNFASYTRLTLGKMSSRSRRDGKDRNAKDTGIRMIQTDSGWPLHSKYQSGHFPVFSAHIGKFLLSLVILQVYRVETVHCCERGFTSRIL